MSSLHQPTARDSRASTSPSPTPAAGLDSALDAPSAPLSRTASFTPRSAAQLDDVALRGALPPRLAHTGSAHSSSYGLALVSTQHDSTDSLFSPGTMTPRTRDAYNKRREELLVGLDEHDQKLALRKLENDIRVDLFHQRQRKLDDTYSKSRDTLLNRTPSVHDADATTHASLPIAERASPVAETKFTPSSERSISQNEAELEKFKEERRLRKQAREDADRKRKQALEKFRKDSESAADSHFETFMAIGNNYEEERIRSRSNRDLFASDGSNLNIASQRSGDAASVRSNSTSRKTGPADLPSVHDAEKVMKQTPNLDNKIASILQRSDSSRRVVEESNTSYAVTSAIADLKLEEIQRSSSVRRRNVNDILLSSPTRSTTRSEADSNHESPVGTAEEVVETVSQPSTKPASKVASIKAPSTQEERVSIHEKISNDVKAIEVVQKEEVQEEKAIVAAAEVVDVVPSATVDASLPVTKTSSENVSSESKRDTSAVPQHTSSSSSESKRETLVSHPSTQSTIVEVKKDATLSNNSKSPSAHVSIEKLAEKEVQDSKASKHRSVAENISLFSSAKPANESSVAVTASVIPETSSTIVKSSINDYASRIEKKGATADINTKSSSFVSTSGATANINSVDTAKISSRVADARRAFEVAQDSSVATTPSTLFENESRKRSLVSEAPTFVATAKTVSTTTDRRTSLDIPSSTFSSTTASGSTRPEASTKLMDRLRNYLQAAGATETEVVQKNASKVREELLRATTRKTEEPFARAKSSEQISVAPEGPRDVKYIPSGVVKGALAVFSSPAPTASTLSLAPERPQKASASIGLTVSELSLSKESNASSELELNRLANDRDYVQKLLRQEREENDRMQALRKIEEDAEENKKRETLRIEQQLKREREELARIEALAVKERENQERADKERADKERAEKECADKERADKERADKERADKERAEKERTDAANVEKALADELRIAREAVEKQRIEREQAEKDRKVDEEEEEALRILAEFEREEQLRAEEKREAAERLEQLEKEDEVKYEHEQASNEVVQRQLAKEHDAAYKLAKEQTERETRARAGGFSTVISPINPNIPSDNVRPSVAETLSESTQTRYKILNALDRGLQDLQSFKRDSIAESKRVSARPSSIMSTMVSKGLEILNRRQILASRKTPSLYILNGKRRIYSSRIPLNSALNSYCVYYLIVPKENVEPEFGVIPATIYLFNGSKVPKVLRARGKETAINIAGKDFNRKGTIVDVEEKIENSNWRFFRSLAKGSIVDEQFDAGEFESSLEQSLTVWALNTVTDVWDCISEPGEPLSSDILARDQCYVLDSLTDIYYWQGKNSSEEARQAASDFAKHVASSRDESITHVMMELDNMESTLFREKFAKFDDRTVSLEVKRLSNIQPKDRQWGVYDRGSDQKGAQRITVEHMYDPPPPPATWDSNVVDGEEILDYGGPPPPELDRGCIELKTWLIQGKDGMLAIQDKEKGVFYSAESYLILYRHFTGREGNEREVAITYFWIGTDSKSTDSGAAAYLATTAIDRKLGARQIRVAQGKEQPHFLSIFGKPMLVKSGSRSDKPEEKSLFQIKGTRTDAVRSMEVPLAATSVVSVASFVLTTKDKVLVYFGEGSFSFERSTALEIAERVADGRPVSVSDESKFIKHLPGDRRSDAFLAQRARHEGVYDCRLFRTSHIIGGNPTAEEIAPFIQSDLQQNGVYILDCFFDIFVWGGENASHKDLLLGLRTSLEYADFVQSKQPMRQLNRDKVFFVRPGSEVLCFRLAFLWFFEEEKRQPIGNTGFLSKLNLARRKVPNSVEKDESVVELLNKMTNTTYSIDVLKNKDTLPMGIDPTATEMYLSESDFFQLFRMDREVFRTLPKWKQSELKKKAGLF